MTTTRGKVVGRPVQRTIVGQPDVVRKAVLAIKDRGDLVVGQPEPAVVPLSGGRIAVAVQVLDRTPAPRPRRRVRVRWVAAGTVAGAGVVGLGLLVVLAWKLILVAVVIAALVAWRLLGRSHRGCEITVIHKRR